MKRLIAVLAIVALAVLHIPTSPEAATQLGSRWTEFNASGANGQATVTHAAVAGKKHIANCIQATFATSTTASPSIVTLVLRDGLSGAGTIRYQHNMVVVGDEQMAPVLQLCGLSIPGTTGNAMTLEFTGPGGTASFESVFMQGFTE